MNHRSHNFVAVIAAILSLFTLSVHNISAQPVGKEWGVTVEWTHKLSDFEALVGKPANMQAAFVHWGNENELPQKISVPLKASGKTIVIFWEAMDYNYAPEQQPQFSYDSILKGVWDEYIKDFARQLKNYDSKVILIPFPEMNGAWTPAGAGLYTNTPEKHKQAYRRIHALFTQENAITENIKFAWTVNEKPAHSIAAYYPGSDVVDFVGVDGFNWGYEWRPFIKIFSPALAELEKFKKPIYIFSFASVSGPAKASWTADALNQIRKDDRISGWLWFNIHKERNWEISSDARSIKAFQDAVRE